MIDLFFGVRHYSSGEVVDMCRFGVGCPTMEEKDDRDGKTKILTEVSFFVQKDF